MFIDENIIVGTTEIGDATYDDDKRDYVLYKDVHQTLVVHKSLMTLKGDSEVDWLQTNTFHTTCTILDRVCRLIIDISNCENLVP